MSSTYLKIVCNCFLHFARQLPFLKSDRIAAKDLLRLIPQVIANKTLLIESSNFFQLENFLAKNRQAANRQAPSSPTSSSSVAAAAPGAANPPIFHDLNATDLTDADLSENEFKLMIRSEAEIAEILKHERKL